MPTTRISVIVPTLDEAVNLPPLLKRIADVLADESYEVLIVDDDSADNTREVCDHLAQVYPLRLIVRTKPSSGLSGAVLEGMASARGAFLVVMDADLQHPPERIPALVEPLATGEADFVFGSRYTADGTIAGGWALDRRIVSRGASLLARPLVGPLRDPMSGFFAIPREVYADIRGLAPLGYKIGLEILCKCSSPRVREVPIHFGARQAGQSKLTVQQQMHYLRHLGRLYRLTLDGKRSTMMKGIRGGGVSLGEHGRSLRGALEVSSRWLGVVGGMFLLMLGLRVAAMAAAPLIPEEAYYWMYGQHPALSYYDHPPLVAWIIQLGTLVFGDTELGVRLVGGLMMLGASGLMYRFGRIWYGRNAGLIAAFSLQILPFYVGIGFIATMDSALVFFWMLGLLAVSEALKHARPGAWYLAGFAVGAALLSKYTGVFLGAGMVLAVLGRPAWRHHLKSVHPYLAALLALLMFSPVLIWNAQHDWASFRFQFIARFADDSLGLRSVLTFLLYQLAVLTPFVLAGLVLLFRRLLAAPARILTPRWLIATAFSLPLLAVMVYKSFWTEIHINWTAPLYLSLLPGLAWMALAHARWARRAGRWFQWVPGIRQTATGCLAVNIGLFLFLLTIQPAWPVISAFGPWRSLARAVERHENQIEARIGEEPLVVADGDYRLASVLAFYRTPIEPDVVASDFTTNQTMVSAEGLGYEYWTRRGDWHGRTVLYIDENDDFRREVASWFDSIEPLNSRELAIGDGYYVVLCRNYRLASRR